MSQIPSRRPACPSCSDNRVHRHGRTSAGRQRYQCASCKRTFTLHSRNPLNRFRLRPQLLQFKKLMALGNSVRHDARILGVSHSTVWRWRHREMARICSAQAPPSIPEGTSVLREHTLLPSRTFWGSLLNTTWAAQRGLDFLSEWRCQHTHPDQCTSVSFVATQPSHGRVSFSVLTYAGSLEAAQLFAGEPSGSREAYRMTGTWAIPMMPDESEPLPLHAVLMKREHRHLNEARQAALALETTFRRWMARFRGVAMRYLRSYVAWFAELLGNGDVAPAHPCGETRLCWQPM